MSAPYSSIFSQLNQDTVLLTPNRRLSATLAKLHQDYQIASGQQSWQTPTILPMTSWLQHLWMEYISHSYRTAPLLLTTAQEQFLWEQILVDTKASDLLLQVSETADLIKSAWALLKQWQVDINLPVFSSSQDYLMLKTWATDFKQKCHDNNWIDMASLPNAINTLVSDGIIEPPKKIILVGFTEVTPQLKNLLNQCESQGSTIDYGTSLTLNQTQTSRLTLLDKESEILTMARWAKSINQQNSKHRVACVVPGLENCRDRVMQIFSEVLVDEHLYNVSAGKSLSRYPIINTAFLLLSLSKKSISTEQFSSLLLSPFVGEGEVERIARALYESHLRKMNVTQLDLIKSTATDDAFLLAKYCPFLHKRITQFIAELNENNVVMSHTDWAKRFTTLLSLLGWPGERSLNSEEYQIVESWLDLLSEFSRLDQVSSAVNFSSALHHLQRLVSKSIFQPRTPDAPIQILGVLEAAALPFDYMWLSGMDDLSWPPPPKPNPFIPKRIQRELQMPHATAEREHKFCLILLAQFRQCASQLIYSYGEKNNEIELQPSPLIWDAREIKLSDLNLTPYFTPHEQIYHSRKIESLCDDMAPALIAVEKIRGGINVIKQQASCPFRAFSEWRLHAHELEKPMPGLRAKDRGNVLHKALEMLWNKIQDHASLISLSDTSLEQIIESCVSEALTVLPTPQLANRQYISLEKQRLKQLILGWLNLERQRTPFKVLLNEKLIEMTISQLKFSIRIDRIDELEDGKKLIIDYKTGKYNEINSWFGERIDEPQLPLYSLYDPENTAGISFAQVSSGEHCFKGVSQYNLDIHGIKQLSDIKKSTAESWHAQLNQWQDILTKLSDDFHHGIAKVDPKDPPHTCEWCALKPLCRVNEDNFVCN